MAPPPPSTSPVGMMPPPYRAMLQGHTGSAHSAIPHAGTGFSGFCPNPRATTWGLVRTPNTWLHPKQIRSVKFCSGTNLYEKDLIAGAPAKHVLSPLEIRSRAQGNCSAKSLAGNVADSSLSSLSSRGGSRAGGSRGGLGAGGWGGGGGSGGEGRGHFIHLAIHCTTTWCFAPKGLRTINTPVVRSFVDPDNHPDICMQRSDSIEIPLVRVTACRTRARLGRKRRSFAIGRFGKHIMQT